MLLIIQFVCSVSQWHAIENTACGITYNSHMQKNGGEGDTRLKTQYTICVRSTAYIFEVIQNIATML